MNDLGLSPRIQADTICTDHRTKNSCYLVENVIGVLPPNAAAQPGVPARPDALLLLSHYDSVPTAPGAGDAAAGSSVVLETVRALALRSDRRHPVIAVIDDGEEVDLLGAQVFLRDPLAKQVAVVLNFEARGTAGQASMFEASDRSAWLIEAFARVAPRPVASSLIYSLYKTLPNDTDLTVTKHAGLLGLNFAFADRDWHQHTPADDLSHLDLRSVQHMGDQALAIATELATRPEIPAPPARDHEAVWFDLFCSALVTYPAPLAWALCGVGTLAYLLVLALLVRRGGGKAFGLALLSLLLTLLVAALFSKLAAALVAALSGQPRPWRTVPVPMFTAHLTGALAIAVSLPFALLRGLGRRTEAADGMRPLTSLAALCAALLPFAVVGVLTTIGSVGASYPFVLPVLIGSLVLLGPLLRVPSLCATPTEADFAQGQRQAWHALMPPLLTVGVLWFPILRILLIMMGAKLGLAIALPTVLCAAYLVPVLLLTDPRARQILRACLGVLCLACLVAAAIVPAG